MFPKWHMILLFVAVFLFSVIKPCLADDFWATPPQGNPRMTPDEALMYTQNMLEALKNNDCNEALGNMEKLEKLTNNLPESFTFHKAKCNFELQRYGKTVELLNVFLSKVSKDNNNYQDALTLYTKVVKAYQAQADFAGAFAVIENFFRMNPDKMNPAYNEIVVIKSEIEIKEKEQQAKQEQARRDDEQDKIQRKRERCEEAENDRYEAMTNWGECTPGNDPRGMSATPFVRCREKWAKEQKKASNRKKEYCGHY